MTEPFTPWEVTAADLVSTYKPWNWLDTIFLSDMSGVVKHEDRQGRRMEMPPDLLQNLRRLLIDVAGHIVKGRQKEALSSLKEIEDIVIREQQPVKATPPVSDDKPPG